MATELGVGIRVWVGWTPDDKLMEHRWRAGEARCKTGTLTGGPFQPGKHYGASGEGYELRVTCWNVDIDGVGEVFASENLLYPMDDGDPAEQDESIERPRALEEA